ncbi:hypothetical protein [Agrobacterium rubi]|uniref:Uncharacterized protein n=1 Tax=Agrobacterium rubi TaxID=28099 RepID=A0AAE7UPZ2_9HYPH|nr:hypothetical protein [Agrobacterium rubi]NTE86430.1 hypothetical protein [Agrobacterium rubi]NTF02362.1 hypothetical protein [Agrobacterium rubi]NTF36606.1 hypothetical protein [Agrobacterium rubi]OCJ55749.1 hypothetical protein A6U92_04065 [Agrobacterium rubi]QTF99064.1 hypothetical protein G6M88_00995 [Agrobacterium rubi]
MDDDQSAARFLAVAEQISQTAPVALDATGAALIAAVHLGIGNDSRSLSNKLGIAHALVLREINGLSGRMLTIVKRDTRTQRTWVDLTDEASSLASSASEILLKSSLAAE